MCGICGKAGFNGNIDETLIRKMCEALAHRGPDDEGVYIAEDRGQRTEDRIRVGLGHRRLSIIDLSSAGHQPMANEDETVWIVLNGEIYNYLELKDTLKAKGHIFRSNTDTEVILHLYEEKGVDCLQDLRGMFAFAIWDEEKQILFLARDRTGKKPLCYTTINGSIIFASEIKSILQDPEVTREVDANMVPYYLSYGYTPSPWSMFKGINKLPPAHYLIYHNGDIKVQRYWQLDFSNKTKLTEEEYCRQVLGQLKEATKIRLISDVPLGAFLSGGIDSSAVVAMMAQQMSGPVKTFSIGFQEAVHSELKYARIVAKAFGTDHHEYIVKPDAMEALTKLVWNYSEPYCDSSALPSFYVAKITRQNVTVALNGDGGDENFAGYKRYIVTKFSQMMPYSARKALAEILCNTTGNYVRRNSLLAKMRRFSSVAFLPLRERYYNWITIFRDNEKDFLYTDEFKRKIDNVKPYLYLKGIFDNYNGNDVIDSLLYADINSYLPEDLLVKVDIAAMSNSLEARSPFLDHKFMEFAARIPSSMKIKGITLKYILKKSLKGILPQEILKRGKMGFGVPIGDWFRSECKDYVYNILLSDKCVKRRYFKKESIKRLLDDHIQGKTNSGEKIWSLLNLELWHRMFIDKENM